MTFCVVYVINASRSLLDDLDWLDNNYQLILFWGCLSGSGAKILLLTALRASTSNPIAVNRPSRLRRMPSSITALADARPSINPICIMRKKPAVATDLYFLSTAACVLMKVAACAMPVPNPAGTM